MILYLWDDFMNKILEKPNIYYLIGIIIIILIIFFLLFINTDNSFKFETKNDSIYEDNYKISITYPHFNSKKVNKEINEFIEEEKELFLNTVENYKNYENELNINYSYTVKDDIYSIHLRLYSYTGDDNYYYRKDKIFYFDARNNTQIYNNSLIDNNDIYQIFRNNVLNYIKRNTYNFEFYDNATINEKIDAKKSNYKLVIFGDENLYLIFPPNTISTYEGEISIPVEYNEVYQYLNKSYISNIIGDFQETSSEKVQRIRNYTDFESKKFIAFKFDDGHSYNKTERLIQELELRNARVSFFMLGELASRQADLVKMVYDKGHTIGSHTYDHKNLKKLNDEQLMYEINYTNDILKNIIGQDIKYLRPPYGSYNKDILDKINMSFILWNVDTLDWQLRDADKIAAYIVENAEDGDIILLHDIHTESVDGVIKAIDILKEQGFAFVSLDEMIKYKNVNIQPHTAYRFFK